ncbi:isocitrate lyase/PEP mutase family protein [Microbacterium aoyamense]|uniref:isocitrate lyase/PEP mutase family protein n=1 Tax=Microbacterium aoyamense TaxID=344166 RepID=UPI00200385AF|nr:isocitrate lyase/PEP mutase family protein [Microbacterium aoyamense]
MTIPRFSDGLGPMTILPAVWDVLSAATARSVGTTHLFLSGAALNNVHGYPDRGLMDTEDVARTVKEITRATGLPIMVDAEAGFGGLPKFGRLLDELAMAGCNAIMIEDQDESGATKTVGVEQKLCDPQVMVDRLEFIRKHFGDHFEILARTDYLLLMDFAESLERLEIYDAAGADWVVPVFAPSKDALVAAGERFPGRLMVLAASPPINGAMKYVTRWEDMQEIQPVAVKVTGEYRNVVPPLQESYRQALTGDWRTLFDGRPDPVWFDEMLGLTRPLMEG